MVAIKTKRPQVIIFLSYFLFSLSITLLFYVAAAKKGTYTRPEILLGTIWTFILSMVISTSLVPGFIKKRLSI